MLNSHQEKDLTNQLKVLILTVLPVYFSSNGFCNGPITVYVNPMSTDGGTGTERTIDPSNPNRAFRSIKHVEAQNLNMTTLGIDSYTIVCYSTQTENDRSIPFDIRYDTSSFAWNGWTQSSTQTVFITVRGSFDQHIGTITDRGYKLIPTNIGGNMISFAVGDGALKAWLCFLLGQTEALSRQ